METSGIQNKLKLDVSKIKPSVFLSTKEYVGICSKDDSHSAEKWGPLWETEMMGNMGTALVTDASCATPAKHMNSLCPKASTQTLPVSDAALLEIPCLISAATSSLLKTFLLCKLRWGHLLMNDSRYTGGPEMGLAGRSLNPTPTPRRSFINGRSRPTARFLLGQLCTMAVSQILGFASSWRLIGG